MDSIMVRAYENMNGDILDALEKRITALELQVMPKDNKSIEIKTQAIQDLLLHTETMISSALNCRDAVTFVLQRMSTINEYLDPLQGETDLELEAKRQCVLELYPQLQDIVHLVRNFASLIPFTDSVNISKITELSDKLDSLSVANLTIYEESREITQNVLKSLQQFNDITGSIKILFAQMDQSITEMEMSLESKLPSEE